MLKGGGSDNASALAMLPPSAGVEGVRRFVLETVEAKATGACPPLVVGVAVGGTFDTVAALAKKALLREIGSPAESTWAEGLESALLQEINATGIGPAGLGGRTDGPGRPRRDRPVPHRRAARGRQPGLLRDALRPPGDRMTLDDDTTIGISAEAPDGSRPPSPPTAGLPAPVRQPQLPQPVDRPDHLGRGRLAGRRPADPARHEAGPGLVDGRRRHHDRQDHPVAADRLGARRAGRPVRPAAGS